MLAPVRKQYVTSERYPVGDKRYDLTVYQFCDAFYAEWYCGDCAERGRTELRFDRAAVYDDGMAAVKAHHLAHHDGTNVALRCGHASLDQRPRD